MIQLEAGNSVSRILPKTIAALRPGYEHKSAKDVSGRGNPYSGLVRVGLG
jgi:hypothetical protein